MCPECFAGVALLLTGVLSMGGVTRAAVKFFRDKKTAADVARMRREGQVRRRSLSEFRTTNPESPEENRK